MKKLSQKKYFLIIISLILFSNHIQAQNGWILKTHIPPTPPRSQPTASVVDGKIYVIGGMTTGFVDVADNYSYDPLTDNWDSLAPMPTPRSFATSAVVNGIIYVIGGGYPTVTNKNEAYDPATDTWTVKANLPGPPRLAMRADVIDGIIYVVGGNYFQNDCYAYDPSTDTWNILAPIPVPNGGGALSVTAYNGLIYTFGGSNYPPWVAFSYVFAYNPQTNTWDTTTLTPMPTARFGLYTYLVGDTIYAVGGSQSEGTALAKVETYYPLTDTWGSKPDMPNAYAWFAGAVAYNKIYVIAGTLDWNTSDYSVWEYDILVGVEEELIHPSNFILEQNYPNPFNPSTKISWQLSEGSNVTLKIFNTIGEEVVTLVNNEYQNAGEHSSLFIVNSTIPSGVYFYQLKAGDYINTKKMLLLK